MGGLRTRRCAALSIDGKTQKYAATVGAGSGCGAGATCGDVARIRREAGQTYVGGEGLYYR